jgi:hypothetical protein
MPDLIIKPAAQSGNKVIIQDQAGGAVITTADSGATIADGIALGTPASGVATNLTGLPAANLTGTVANARINQPAFSVWSNDSNQSIGQSSWTTWAHNQVDLDNKSGVHANNYYEVQAGDNGYWFLIGTVHYGGSIDSSETIAGGIYHNSTEIHSVWASPTFGGGDNMFCTVNAIINASVGSKFYLKGWHSGVSVTVMMNGTDRNTTFMGFKLLI